MLVTSQVRRWTRNFLPILVAGSCSFLVLRATCRAATCDEIVNLINAGSLGQAAERAQTQEGERPCAVFLVEKHLEQGNTNEAIRWINHARRSASAQTDGALFARILYYKLLLDPTTNPHPPWPWDPREEYRELLAAYPEEARKLPEDSVRALQEDRCGCDTIRTFLRDGERSAAELWLKAKEVDERRPCAVLLVKELLRQGERDGAVHWTNFTREGDSWKTCADLHADILYYKLLLDPDTNPHPSRAWDPLGDLNTLKSSYREMAAALEKKARQALEKERDAYVAARWSRACPDRNGFWRQQFPDVLTEAHQVCEAVNRFNEANKPESQSRENVKLAVTAINDLWKPLGDLWGQEETGRLIKQTKLSSYYDLCDRAQGSGLGPSERAGFYQQAVGLVDQTPGRDTEHAREKFAQASLMAEMEKGFAGGSIPAAATETSWRAKSDRLASDFALPVAYVVALGLTESCRRCKMSLAEQGSDVFTTCDAFVNHAAWGTDVMPEAKAVLSKEKTNVAAALRAATDAILSNAETFLKGEAPGKSSFKEPQKVVDLLAYLSEDPFLQNLDIARLNRFRAWANVDVYLDGMAQSTKKPVDRSKEFFNDAWQKGCNLPEEYQNAITMLSAFEGCRPHEVRGSDSPCTDVQARDWKDPCRSVVEATYWEKMRYKSAFYRKYHGEARQTVEDTAKWLLDEFFLAESTNDAKQIKACIDALDGKGYKDYAKDKDAAEAAIASAREAHLRPMLTPTPAVRANPIATPPRPGKHGPTPSERPERSADGAAKERIEKIFFFCSRRAVNFPQADQVFMSLTKEHGYVAPNGEVFDCQGWMIWDLLGDIQRNQGKEVRAVENYVNGGAAKPQMLEHFESKIVDMLARGNITFEKFGNLPLEGWVKQHKGAIIQKAKNRPKDTHVVEPSAAKEQPPRLTSAAVIRTETRPPQPAPTQTARSASQPDVAPNPGQTPPPCVPDKYFEVAQKTYNGESVEHAPLDQVQEALVRLIQQLKATDTGARDTTYARQKAQLQELLEANSNEERRVEVFAQVRFAIRYFETKSYLKAASPSKARDALEKARSDLRGLTLPCYADFIHVLEKDLDAMAL